ncbi:hypothetical protein C8R44DRAFT_69296 [Mycena epipterygia]|nr:hypothetical protein C8R44DRAFT_69296 [Mycena epipterygia]
MPYHLGLSRPQYRSPQALRDIILWASNDDKFALSQVCRVSPERRHSTLLPLLSSSFTANSQLPPRRIVIAFPLYQEIRTYVRHAFASMPCSSWGEEREKVWGQILNLVAKALSHGLPGTGRPSSSHHGSEGKRRRLETLSRSSGHMETSREAENAVPRNVDIKLVSIAAPTAQQLDLVIRVPNCGRR